MNEVFYYSIPIVKCLSEEDKMMQNQSSFQLKVSDKEYLKNMIFKDNVIEINCQMRSLFGFDEIYVYQYNFSYN